MDTVLSISWSVSRGRETYGYNICRLDDQESGKRYRCMGGGYDMVGTVVGEWLQDRYQDRLRELTAAARAYYDYRGAEPGAQVNSAGLYGLIVTGSGAARLDGGCGIESMQRIAREIGLDLQRTYKTHGRQRGETTGWVVTDTWNTAG